MNSKFNLSVGSGEGIVTVPLGSCC